MVDPAVPMDVSALRKSFNANVFGQERAVAAVVDMLAAVKTALTRTGKPIASFLFAGPTGVGKTELAKVLAATMFGSRDRMLRFDMSEFSSPWSVMRLTGEGYYSEGLLTNAVRRDPFCVLLFDEIEKADAKFYELLLQILSEGRLSDSRGRVVNFCSAIIIMTTNIGAANLNRHRISWKKEIGVKDVAQHFNSAIEQHFRPELYNRIDAIVAFSPLDPATVRFVVEREIQLLRNREGIRFRPLNLTVEESVSDHLAEVGYDARFGARYLQRAIREKLAVPLAEALNEYAFDERLNVHLSMENGAISLEVSADALGFDLLMEQWDRLTLAEKASHQRRKLALLFESPLYLRYQSELDMLENERERQTAAFWKNEAQAKRQAALEKGQVLANAVLDEIQEMEVEIALACMGQSGFSLDFGERLEAWESSFFQLQTRLHSLIFPKRDSCQFGLYGMQLSDAIQFYLALFKSKGFEVVAAQAVWFREGYTEAAEQEKGNRRGKQLAYFYQPVSISAAANLNAKPPLAGDKLCGIEMVVAGTGAWLFLRDEKGLQLWQNKAEEDPNHVYVLTSLTKIKTPEEVYRQAFYTNFKARRHFSPTGFWDTKLNLATTLPPLENIGQLVEKLEEAYKLALTRAFLSSDAEE
jgi:ATP-dependent Clp protease ATP-binding subunit ClpA